MAEWVPLSGKDKERAEQELLRFKKALDKEFRKGSFTADQCRAMVKEKEVELGLAQPPSVIPEAPTEAPTEMAPIELPKPEEPAPEAPPLPPEVAAGAQPEEQAPVEEVPAEPTPAEETPPPPTEEVSPTELAPEPEPQEPLPIPKEEALPVELGTEPVPEKTLGEEAQPAPEGKPAPEQAETIECQSCGAVLSAGVTVCEICGTPVPGSKEPVAEVPVAGEPAPEGEQAEQPAEQPTEPVPAPVPAWVPLPPKEQKHAEKELLKFKKYLEKEFERGRMTADECKAKVREKEIELGLVPPPQPVPEEAPAVAPAEEVPGEALAEEAPKEPAPEEKPAELPPEAPAEVPPEAPPAEELVPEPAPVEEVSVEMLECPACGATAPMGTEKCEVCGTLLLVKEGEAPVPEPIKEELPSQPPVGERRIEETPRPPAVAPAYVPLSPREQKQAEKDIYNFKKYLDKEYKKGRISADEARAKIREKEIELRLVALPSEPLPPQLVSERTPEERPVEVIVQPAPQTPPAAPPEIPKPEEPAPEAPPPPPAELPPEEPKPEIPPEETVECKFCGAAVPASAETCTVCGESLIEKPAEAPVPEMPPEPVPEEVPSEAAVEEEKVEEVPQPAPVIAPVFIPLSPKEQKRAEKELQHFKKYLDKECRKGRMSAEDAQRQLKNKEVELGLVPPTEAHVEEAIPPPVEEAPEEVPAPAEEVPAEAPVEELPEELLPEAPEEVPEAAKEVLQPVEEVEPEMREEEVVPEEAKYVELPEREEEISEATAREMDKLDREEQEGVECLTCGAMAEPGTAECPVCNTAFPEGIATAPAKEKRPAVAEEGPAPGEITCPSCGAFVSAGMKECPICDTKLEAEVKPAPEIPRKISVKPKEELPPEAPEEMPALEEPASEEFPEAAKEVPQPVEEVEELGLEPTPEEEAEPEMREEERVPEQAKYVELPEREEGISEALAREMDKLDREEQEGIECPACGAMAKPGTAKCPVCKTALPEGLVPALVREERPAVAEEEPAPEISEKMGVEPEEELPSLPPPPPEKEQVTCPSCGAFMEPGSTECFICGAKIGKEAEEELPSAPEREELTCPSCAAILEPDSTECFICGAKIREGRAEPEIELVTAAEEGPAPEEVEELVEEVKLEAGEIICPECSSIIPEGNEKCPECWTDLTQYVKCSSCGMLTPAGGETCKHCLASIGISVEEIEEEMGEEIYLPEELVITEAEISPALEREMSLLDAEEEQGKECMVCGAIFGPEDELCPVCKQPYGTVLEEPPELEPAWEGMGVELAPTVYICPHCKEKIKGMEATEREESERKWFYWGIIVIFTGIFFNSFSIWVRGVTVENESLGMHPGPADVLVNILGWILVIIGFMFWIRSWRLHESKIECPKCGVEVTEDMATCIYCGTELEFEEELGEELEEEKAAEEELEAGVPEEVVEEKVKAEIAETARPKRRKRAEAPIPAVPPEPTEEVIEEMLGIPEPIAEEEAPEVPEEVMEEEPAVQLKPVPAPSMAPPEPAPPRKKAPADELEAEHEQHKKCPSCGIFLELDATICPVCDTTFDAKPLPDKEIEVPSEAEELETMGGPAVEDVEFESEIPEDAKYVEIAESAEVSESLEAELAALDAEEASGAACPECGAIIEPGKNCPVCKKGFTAISKLEPTPEKIEEPAAAGEEVDCPSCGAVISSTDEVCPICEYPIKAQQDALKK